MATIKEDYVSFEIAKLLKEKGFNEETEHVYSAGGEFLKLSHFGIKNLTNADCNNYHTWQFPIEGVASIISAPTLQMAMKWLRIEHNIHIEPHIVKTKYSYGYMPNYIDLKELKPHFPFDEFDFSNADKYVCTTYDKACETSIKYCLINLI